MVTCGPLAANESSEQMPNAIAFAMLLVWPFVAYMLFTRTTVEKALIWTIVAGYLLLPPPPAGFDFPLLPPFDKDAIPSFSAFVMCFFLYGHQGSLLPESLPARVLVFIFVFSPVLTVLTNGEPVFYGQVGLPGLGIPDAIALSIRQFLFLIPFLLARRFLIDSNSQREILKIFVINM